MEYGCGYGNVMDVIWTWILSDKRCGHGCGCAKCGHAFDMDVFMNVVNYMIITHGCHLEVVMNYDDESGHGFRH